MRGRLATALAAGSAALLLAPAGAMATRFVTTPSDAGPGSLREAVEESPSGETIVVPAGTYTLASGELQNTGRSLTIAGAGAAVTIIRAEDKSRVFGLTGTKPAPTVKITGVTIREGEVSAATADGGGISATGVDLVLEQVLVTDNHADADGAPSTKGGEAKGGGVYVHEGTLQLSASSISGNVASAVGGTEEHAGVATGGGVFTEGGPFTISASSFDEDEADARGGQASPGSSKQFGGIAEGGGLFAVLSEGEGASVSSVEADSDTATASAGPGGGGGISDGGGVFSVIDGPPLTVSAATMSGDRALAVGGGIVNGGAMFVNSNGAGYLIDDATIVGNLISSEPGGIAEGGGLFAGANNETSTLANDTLDGNTAEGAGKGGDLLADPKVQVANTIVAGGSASAETQNCYGEPTSLGHNIDSLDQCAFHAAGDLKNTEPLLGPLQLNGGLVQTQALRPGSPAIDAGAQGPCPAFDARGVKRPQGAACDIGAFELAPPSVTTAPASAVGVRAATLNGIVSNPDVLGGTVAFRYGTTTAYGTQVAGQTLSAGLGALMAGLEGQAVSAPVTGLAPATTYHFEALATNPDGDAAGLDKTFTTASEPVIGPPPPAPPVLSHLQVSPSKLRARTGRGASLASHAPARGATIAYRDSEAAKTTFTVLVRREGFKVGHRCQATRPRHAHAPRRCPRFVALHGTFSHADGAGAVRLRFTGRVGGRPLAPGRYRLSAVARNAAGLSSRAVTADFTVIG